MCKAVVLFAAATATHGNKDSFDREVGESFRHEPDDMVASQLHVAYCYLISKLHADSQADSSYVLRRTSQDRFQHVPSNGRLFTFA